MDGHVRSCYNILCIGLDLARSCFKFSRCSTKWLFPISKLEEIGRRQDIWPERWNQRSNKGLFWWIKKILLLARGQRIGKNWRSVWSSKDTSLRHTNFSLKNLCFIQGLVDLTSYKQQPNHILHTLCRQFFVLRFEFVEIITTY